MRIKPIEGGDMEVGQAVPADVGPCVVDIQETQQGYLVAVDLPSLQDMGVGEIRLNRNGLSVLGSDPVDPGVLLRCVASSDKVRARYQHGVLWLLLPKQDPALAGAL